MEILHFTPGSLDPQNVRRHGTVAHLPLAAGQGAWQLSCLYLAPRRAIVVPAATHRQLLQIVNGKTDARFPGGALLQLSAGMGMLLRPEEGCHLSSSTGTVILTLEADQMAADPCGISHPERVMGQQWPNFESN
jgi:hypothetical protein